MTPPIINPQTWEERVNAEFYQKGGSNLPSALHPQSTERRLLINAHFHADKSMLSEIHAMLLFLCEKAVT